MVNQTRLQLFALAYNLANFLRRLALPKSIRQWSLTTLREKLVKIGAKVTRHSKYVTFQLAEVGTISIPTGILPATCLLPWGNWHSGRIRAASKWRIPVKEQS